MDRQAWEPEEDLLSSDDHELWAGRFISHGRLDPGFLLDQQAVSAWFGRAMLAARRTDLARVGKDLALAKRSMRITRVILVVVMMLLLAVIIRFSLQLSGVIR